jgi:YfiH family protein
MTLKRIESPNLPNVNHGFYTRLGGASSGIFHGLNCGIGSSDQSEIVKINRARVAQDMGGTDTNLIALHQFHSAKVVIVDDTFTNRPHADGVVSNRKGDILTILTADCQPVLFHDPDAGVIGACHAGWKGALAGVIGATVDGMILLGATRENISAAIGPCISQPAYEVGAEFRDQFVEHDPTFQAFFIAGALDGKFQFNLPALGLQILKAAGIKSAHWIAQCTYSNEEYYYSYRRTTHRAEADYGRLISCITL